MLKDFLIFLRHVFAVLQFVRGVLGALLVILLLCAYVLMVAEGLSLGKVMYLTAITGLTVGYGDIVPTTAIGRVATIVIGFVGVIYVGIVVAVVTRALNQAVEAERRRRSTSPDNEGIRGDK